MRTVRKRRLVSARMINIAILVWTISVAVSIIVNMYWFILDMVAR